MSESTDELREKLRAEVMAVPWQALVPHLARGGLLLLAPEVDLLDAAEALARDDKAWVERALREGILGRASDEAAGSLSPEQRFQCVIVQPFVLAQPILAADPS